MLRIRYSRALCSRKPPLVLAAKFLSAPSICSSVTPNACICAGSGSTRYCLTSPPIGMTCATPGMVSRRGRSTQSAYSRTCIGFTRAGSTGSAISMISPMIEAIGPICGAMPSGSCSFTSDNRSATCWRLRKISVPQSNSTNTIESPMPETERTRVTPGMPFIAVSTGNVTSCSTSSGAMPPASVSSVTVGLFRSGKISTVICCAVRAP